MGSLEIDLILLEVNLKLFFFCFNFYFKIVYFLLRVFFKSFCILVYQEATVEAAVVVVDRRSM